MLWQGPSWLISRAKFCHFVAIVVAAVATSGASMDRAYETFAKCWAGVALRSPNAPGDPFLSSVSQSFSGEIKAPSLEPAKVRSGTLVTMSGRG
ncbi:hypothetical protein CMUS01_05335 [Colletotrichum musicola]|uniref:Secreted protein n=1 Tax=Colletotrichum musicola TaxID=2175873 RepID=A0A8H6KSU5_9PEZI|nr:hypothetical protein CMUS01_05335 [Colletotrichum musicola]